MLPNNDKEPVKKILFAVGGTGGHLFPAQALAKELTAQNHEILFAGGRLGANPFFHPTQFPFKEVQGASPFRTNPLKAGLKLLSGIQEGIKVIDDFEPDFVVGFGSFYSFPILTAARRKKVPYILVESNAYPGKVNRLFSSRSLFSVVQFEEASSLLKGKVIPAKLPLWSKENDQAFLEQSEAKKYFGLDPDRFTFLIFGGSQGAAALNQVAHSLESDLQVIHLCGRGYDEEKLRKLYQQKGIHASVKPFEEKMKIALKAADLALTRAGGGTISELIEYTLPSILVPWPGASENHQFKNAKILSDKGGAILLEETNISSFPAHFQEARGKLDLMRNILIKEKQKEMKKLFEIIHETISL